MEIFEILKWKNILIFFFGFYLSKIGTNPCQNLHSGGLEEGEGL